MNILNAQQHADAVRALAIMSDYTDNIVIAELRESLRLSVRGYEAQRRFNESQKQKLNYGNRIQ